MSEADGASNWELWIDRGGGYGSPSARRQAADQA
jgi:hypothetical protein